MASHDLSNTKTTILGATPGAIPGIDGNLLERFSFAPAFSEVFFFSRIGVIPAHQIWNKFQNQMLTRVIINVRSVLFIADVMYLRHDNL